MKLIAFGSDIHLENVYSGRNDQPGEFDQAFASRLAGCLHGGDEVPNLEAPPGHAQPPVGQPDADFEAERRGLACRYHALALPLRLLHAGKPQ